MLVAAAGNLDHDELAARVGAAFAGFAGIGRRRPSPNGRPFTRGVDVTLDDTEQAYVMLGMPGLSMRDERRYALSVLDTILGGGMSSRLFQEVREERGLAYEISRFSKPIAKPGCSASAPGRRPTACKSAST